jgi:hypothetical protein
MFRLSRQVAGTEEPEVYPPLAREITMPLNAPPIGRSPCCGGKPPIRDSGRSRHSSRAHSAVLRPDQPESVVRSSCADRRKRQRIMCWLCFCKSHPNQTRPVGVSRHYRTACASVMQSFDPEAKAVRAVRLSPTATGDEALRCLKLACAAIPLTPAGRRIEEFPVERTVWLGMAASLAH